MSFRFNWDFFDQDSLYDKAREVLRETMNKGKIPPVIVDELTVRDLDLGTVAPKLEILEIGDMASDKFRGVFKLEYDGDASLTLQTTIEANSLAQSFQDPNLHFISPGFGFAVDSLQLPLEINLSDIRLSAIIILVFSRARGLTLVFRNDPLQSCTVTSTFDFIPGVSAFLRKEIEERLRESFREDIPEVLYQISMEMEAGSKTPFHYQADHHVQLKGVNSSIAYTAIPPPLDSEHTHYFDLELLTGSRNTLALSPNHDDKDVVTRAALENFEFRYSPEKEEAKVHHRTTSKVTSVNELERILRSRVRSGMSSPSDSKHSGPIAPRRRVVRINTERPDSKEVPRQSVQFHPLTPKSTIPCKPSPIQTGLEKLGTSPPPNYHSVH